MYNPNKRKRRRQAPYGFEGGIQLRLTTMKATLSILLTLQVSLSVAFVVTNKNNNFRGGYDISTNNNNNMYASTNVQHDCTGRTSLHSIVPPCRYQVSHVSGSLSSKSRRNYINSRSSSSSSALQMVWWYGGSDTADERTDDNESCELVAVRIERTSANSRRIFGEITAHSVGIDDVWTILTDYDNLSTHVPNLVESRIVQRLSSGKPGDGQYRCRLYQKGAQKIIGFEFGASVTMDMKESYTFSPLVQQQEVRKINFKCYDSFFFQEFDGDWEVSERVNPITNEIDTVVSYVVEVRPKGPVPVAALEWRIREDVPTNLRAVKKAATAWRIKKQLLFGTSSSSSSTTSSSASTQSASKTMKNGLATIQNGVKKARASLAQDARMKIQWYKDETMAAYLSDS